MSAAERLMRRHRVGNEPPRSAVLAWDLPTRLFKWTLVLLVISAWVSSGSQDPVMTVHKGVGYAVATLVVYRVLWGFLGGSTARFSSFVRSPAVIIAYLRALKRGSDRPYLGHNPLGGLMIVGLLLACAIQVSLGLFASDGVMASGPFADAIGDHWSARAAKLHALWFYAILGLALIHIAVNLLHQFIKRDNLIGAMITGRKPKAPYADADGQARGSLSVALLCLGMAVAIVYFGVATLGGQFFAS